MNLFIPFNSTPINNTQSQYGAMIFLCECYWKMNCLIERARDVCVQFTFASEGVDVDNNDDDGGSGGCDGGSSGTRLARYKWITLSLVRLLAHYIICRDYIWKKSIRRKCVSNGNKPQRVKEKRREKNKMSHCCWGFCGFRCSCWKITKAIGFIRGFVIYSELDYMNRMNKKWWQRRRQQQHTRKRRNK